MTISEFIKNEKEESYIYLSIYIYINIEMYENHSMKGLRERLPVFWVVWGNHISQQGKQFIAKESYLKESEIVQRKDTLS